MGRPPKPLDAEQVYKLAKLGCTQDEIADIFGVDQATISRRFSSECARARSECKMSLRRAQMRRAIKDRSDSMLIHLGKVYLGQGGTDRAEVTLTVADAMRVVDQVERALGGSDAGATPSGR